MGLMGPMGPMGRGRCCGGYGPGKWAGLKKTPDSDAALGSRSRFRRHPFPSVGGFLTPLIPGIFRIPFSALQDEHAVAVAVESVTFPDRLCIGLERQFPASQGADQHQ